MIRLTLLGEPASKANSRQIVMMGRGPKARPAVIKSEKARDYERDAIKQIPLAAKVMLQGPVRVTIRVFYASERPDLDESVILDVLQAKFEKQHVRYEKLADGLGIQSIEERVCVRRGVYLNDRQVREKHIFHAIDRKNPRAEIEVEQLVAELFDIPVVVQHEQLPAKPF